MKTSYINYIQLKRCRLSMFQLQAEHRHAAGLIDLLFKGRVICFTAALPYKQVVNKPF